MEENKSESFMTDIKISESEVEDNNEMSEVDVNNAITLAQEVFEEDFEETENVRAYHQTMAMPEIRTIPHVESFELQPLYTKLEQ